MEQTGLEQMEEALSEALLAGMGSRQGELSKNLEKVNYLNFDTSYRRLEYPGVKGRFLSKLGGMTDGGQRLILGSGTLRDLDEAHGVAGGQEKLKIKEGAVGGWFNCVEDLERVRKLGMLMGEPLLGGEFGTENIGVLKSIKKKYYAGPR